MAQQLYLEETQRAKADLLNNLNMRYNSFYFLHIPKTDGRRFIDSIVIPLQNNNTELNFIGGELGFHVREKSNPHQGWVKSIDQKTYIVSILRDPIERAVSYYIFIMMQKIKAIEGFSKYKKVVFSKDQFIKYIKEQKDMHNLSSKMFLHHIPSQKDRGILFDDISIKLPESVDLIMERAQRINLLIRSDTFKGLNRQDLFNRITSDIGISSIPCFGISPEIESEYTEKESKELYLSLNDSDKSALRQYFDLDYEIYNNESLFSVI